MISWLSPWCLVGCSLGTLARAIAVIPTPQYLERRRDSAAVAHGGQVFIVIGPAKTRDSAKSRLAVEFLKEDLMILKHV